MASGVFWLSAGSLPAKIATLAATWLVIRILGAYTYGEFTLVRAAVNAFVTVATFGMGRTAAKYVSEFLVTDRERVGRIVALNYAFTFISSLVIAVLFCVLGRNRAKLHTWLGRFQLDPLFYSNAGA